MTADPAELGGDSEPRAADWDVRTPPLKWCGLASPLGDRRLPTPPAGWWRLLAPSARLPGFAYPAAPAWWGVTAARGRRGVEEPPDVGARVIFDLCAGSGEWSRPYVEAGYVVVRVTLPDNDVRTWVPPCRPWGVLCAPPCNEFSRAKRAEHDHVVGMETVNACLRVVAQTRPRWWALENPQGGDLSKFIGLPQWTFQPYEFGDAWTKATGLWGEFNPPVDGRCLVTPMSSAMERRGSAARAVTPPGFARAFFGANP